MQRLVPLITGEAYHVFNRGAHKSVIFKGYGEYERFQALLLVCNRKESTHLANLLTKYKGPSFIKLFDEEVVGEDERLVEVLSYCLMPNHFHLVVRQKVEDGITTFMRKVGTAYSMYFNAKHEHSGTLFQGRFKSVHVDNDAHYKWLFQYVHLNPVELFEPKWKENGVKNAPGAERFLARYHWSSHYDYVVGERPQRSILSKDSVIGAIDFQDAVAYIREHPSF